MGSYIFNEAARRKFEKLHLGTTLGGESIIGFCADFKFGNMHDEVTPMAFKLMNSPLYENWFWKNYIVVRVREGVTLDDALQAIRDYAAPLVEGRDIETLTQLDVLDITYAEDARQLKSLLVFCVLAVLICLTGVYSASWYSNANTGAKKSEYARCWVLLRAASLSCYAKSMLGFWA